MGARRILVTGAAGFVGRALTSRLLQSAEHMDSQIILLDPQPPALLPDEFHGRSIEVIQGNLADASILSAAIGKGVDQVYHLASVVGGAAEADYALARSVNVDATLSLFEHLRDTGCCPRVVFASSIAVFGEPPPAAVDDSTPTNPTMTYGAQKRMMEIALAQFSARSWLDGISLRLPAIVAKPAVPGVRAVFLNEVFHAFAGNEDVTVPVSEHGTLWLLSSDACVEALLYAANLDQKLSANERTLTLPALRIAMQDLVAALARQYPDSSTKVIFAPQPHIEAQFASQPPLTTSTADRLGFVHDVDIGELVARASQSIAGRL